MAAVAARDEEQRIATGRIGRGGERIGARHRDRRRRQAVPRIGVVRRIGFEVATADVAVVGAADAVDHRRVGLQAHADLQPPDENTGDLWTFAGEAGFLLDDGRQGQQFVRRLQRQALRARRPGLGQRLVHRGRRLPEDVEIAGVAREQIGLGQETTFREHALAIQALHDFAVVQGADLVPQARVGEQGRTQVAETPAFDDGELALDHPTVVHALQDRARAHAGGNAVLAHLQARGHFHATREQAPFEIAALGDADAAQLAHDVGEAVARRDFEDFLPAGEFDRPVGELLGAHPQVADAAGRHDQQQDEQPQQTAEDAFSRHA